LNILRFVVALSLIIVVLRQCRQCNQSARTSALAANSLWTTAGLLQDAVVEKLLAAAAADVARMV
jgi:hypothetical protein